MADYRTIIVLALLVGLAGLSFWLLSQRGSGNGDTGAGVLGGADYTLSGFTLTTMDETGATQYQLRSAQLVHYEGEPTAQFEQPDVTVYGAGAPVWHIRSEQGELVGNGDEVHLLGKVTITRILANDRQAPVTINTRNLSLYPEQEMAQTDQRVEIVQAAGTVTGIGMQANLAEQKIMLLADVQGSYEPPTR